MNYTIKRFIAYLAYILLIVFLVLEVESLHLYLKHLFSARYEIRYGQMGIWLLVFFNITMGMLLALPQFLRTRRLPGHWRIDWLPLLTVGPPSLCAAVSPLAYYITPESMVCYFVIKYIALVKILCILLGFVLISSWHKDNPALDNSVPG